MGRGAQSIIVETSNRTIMNNISSDIYTAGLDQNVFAYKCYNCYIFKCFGRLRSKTYPSISKTYIPSSACI